MKNLLPEEKLALWVARGIIDGKPASVPEEIKKRDINWRNFKNIISYHELASFAHTVLEGMDVDMPEDLKGTIKNTYYSSLVRNQRLWQEFLRVLDAFSGAGLDLVPIKGMAFLEDLYRDNPVRPLTDIDLLCRREDVEEAKNIFAGLDYREELLGAEERYWLEDQYHLIFNGSRGGAMSAVELHWGLDYPRDGRIIYTELWQRVREAECAGRKIKVLSPEDNFLSLALHSRRLGKALCFKSVYDAALLLNKRGSDFGWDYCLSICKKYRLYATVYFMLLQIEFISGSFPAPEDISRKFPVSRIRKKVMRRFIGNNSFTADRVGPKELYARSHFLLYDNLWEPVSYVLNIPLEQFAKYYGIEPYARRTGFLYKMRFFYIPFSAVLRLFRKGGNISTGSLPGDVDLKVISRQ